MYQEQEEDWNLGKYLWDSMLVAALMGLAFAAGGWLVSRTLDSAINSFLYGFGFGFLWSIGDDLLNSSRVVAYVFYGLIYVGLAVGMVWAYVANFPDMKTVLRIAAPLGILLVLGVVGTMFWGMTGGGSIKEQGGSD